ncbi:MAG: hypothetical protein J7507_12315 [Pseudoxanthomonas sp.]|nr:hypothetical protein [Pseudoxanthomonas sp.]
MHGAARNSTPTDRPGRPRPGLLLCAGLLAASSAIAQVERTGDYLAKMDTDGDGRISKAEYVAWMSYAFEQMDRDGDGVLSSAELPGGKGKPVTLEEHRKRLAERFLRQDANKDGWLDARELAAPPA